MQSLNDQQIYKSVKDLSTTVCAKKVIIHNSLADCTARSEVLSRASETNCKNSEKSRTILPTLSQPHLPYI